MSDSEDDNPSFDEEPIHRAAREGDLAALRRELEAICGSDAPRLSVRRAGPRGRWLEEVRAGAHHALGADIFQNLPARAPPARNGRARRLVLGPRRPLLSREEKRSIEMAAVLYASGGEFLLRSAREDSISRVFRTLGFTGAPAREALNSKS